MKVDVTSTLLSVASDDFAVRYCAISNPVAVMRHMAEQSVEVAALRSDFDNGYLTADTVIGFTCGLVAGWVTRDPQSRGVCPNEFALAAIMVALRGRIEKLANLSKVMADDGSGAPPTLRLICKELCAAT